MTTRRSAVFTAVAGAALLLGACAHEGQDQMSWARAALERNPQLEVVAADPQSHTFTVRVKDTGEVRTVRVDQVVGTALTDASQGAAPPLAQAVPPADTNTNTVPAAAPAAQEGQSAAPAEADETAAADAAALHAAVPAPGKGHVLESGPGYSIESASGAQQGAPLQSGPGYSVKAVAGAPAVAAAAGRLRDAGVTNAALERRREPIVCQGARLLHIDNRNLAFDGDAVSAEDGCEIYITNTHISATGVGVLARNANVHIDNSLIEGDGGSIDASEGAQVYAASSHFRGLSRRLDSATFHDQGGNIWN